MKERQMNSVGIAVFASIIALAMAIVIAAYTQIQQVLTLKDQAQVALESSLRDAASQSGTVLGLGSGVINPDAAMNVFQQDMNNWLSSAPAGVTWQAEAFQVYQEDMAGTPAPGNIPGDIKGPSVYAKVNVSIPVINIPLLQQDVGFGTITTVVEDMESGNVYLRKENAWNGG